MLQKNPIELQKLRKLCLVTLLLLFVACQGNENTTSREPVPIPAEPVDISPPEVLFTDAVAVATGKQSKVILDRLIELIDAVPEDGSIYVSIYLFEYNPLFEALARAHTRDVSLHVMMDMSDRSNNSDMENKLGMLEENVEIVRIYNNASGSAINHNKFMLFPEVVTSEGILENVIFQTSHNFVDSGTHKIQDGVIVSDIDLYGAYLDYWRDMKSLANVQMDKFNYREYVNTEAGITAYFYPKRRGGGPYGEDTIIEILNDIDVPSSATVKIGMSAWTDSRIAIVNKLSELVSQGVDLQVVTKSSIGDDVYDGLRELSQRGATIKIYNMGGSGGTKINIHSKFMMVEGVWNGEDTKLLLNGTQNFTMNALRNNNEVSLLFKDHQFYEQYEDYFEELKKLTGVCCNSTVNKD